MDLSAPRSSLLLFILILTLSLTSCDPDPDPRGRRSQHRSRANSLFGKDDIQVENPMNLTSASTAARTGKFRMFFGNSYSFQ